MATNIGYTEITADDLADRRLTKLNMLLRDFYVAINSLQGNAGTVKLNSDLDMQKNKIVNANGVVTAPGTTPPGGTTITIGASDLSNGTTGTGAIVLQHGPTVDAVTLVGLVKVGNNSPGVKSIQFTNGINGTLAWNPTGSAKTIMLPNGSTDFTATGGPSQVLRQDSLGAAITVSQLAATDLTNGVTGTGAVVLATAPSITSAALTTPAVGAAGMTLAGSTSGALTVKTAAVASGTLTLPAGTTDLSATGGTSEVLRQSSIGAAITVSQLAAADLSNGTTGSGAVVLATSPTITGLTLDTLTLTGSTSGTLTVKAAAVASGTITLPSGITDFSATGGASQVLRQSSVGAAITVSQLAASDMSNGTTGSGAVVLANTPTLITPVIGAATGTSLTVTGQLISTVATGTAPLVVSSTTNVANLNASSLSGATFAAPGPIGGTTPDAGTFTILTANTSLAIGGGTALTTTNQTGTGSLVLATSPTLNGVPLAPTAVPGTNTTQIATTAFVTAAIGTGGGAVTSVFGRTGAVIATSGDYSFSLISGSVASTQMPALTGDVTSTAGTTVTSITAIQGVTVTGTTGTGKIVLQTSPSLITPALGIATATSLECPQIGNITPGLGVFTTLTANIAVAAGAGGVTILGSTSGSLMIKVAAVALGTLILPAGNTDFSATGGPSQVLRQDSTGAAFTVSQLAASNLSNGTTGSGAVVLAGSPTITTQAICPLLIGGISSTSTLTLQPCLGTGVTGADIIFQTGGGYEIMRVTNGANVGIGTPTPASQLVVYGNAGLGSPVLGTGTLYLDAPTPATGAGGAIVFGGSDATYFAGIKALMTTMTGNTAGELAFYTRRLPGDASLTEAVRIAVTGNFGIGTNNPAAQLHTTGTVRFANFGAGIAQLDSSGNLSSTGSPVIATQATCPLIIGGTGVTSTLTMRSTSGVGTTGADIIFQAGNNGAKELVRMTNDGSVGIGTSSPADTFHIVDRRNANGGPPNGTTSDQGMAIGALSTSGVLNLGIDNNTTGGGYYSWIQSRDRTGASYYNLALNPQGGNVGIGTGTSAPINTLHIIDRVNANGGPPSGTTSNQGIAIGAVSTSGVLNLGIDNNTTGSGYYSWIQSRDRAGASYYNLALNPQGGNVGIGTNNPATQLHTTGQVRFANFLSATLTTDASGNVQGDPMTLFTPTLGSVTTTGTVNFQGYAQKIGKLIFVAITAALVGTSSLATTANVSTFSGLPYISLSGTTWPVTVGDNNTDDKPMGNIYGSILYPPTLSVNNLTVQYITFSGWYFIA